MHLEIELPEAITKLTLIEKVLLIAGFFDGEGCISIGKNGSVSTSIVNTCYANIYFINTVFPGSVSIRNTIVNKPQYMHRLYGDNAINLLTNIGPYLLEKREQAESVIEYFSMREEIKPIFIPGKRGRNANPDRELLINTFRDILKEQKEEWH